MNENHFLLQMSNFQKKIFFLAENFNPKKYLEKKSKIFDFWKMTPRDVFWSLYFHLLDPSLGRAPSSSVYKPEATNPSLIRHGRLRRRHSQL